jgi:drug/metabolite transporter (DMT)-like permease
VVYPFGVRRDIGLQAFSLKLAAVASVLNAFALLRIGAVDAAALSTFCAVAGSIGWALLRGRRLPLRFGPALVGLGLLDGIGAICLFASLERLGPVPVALFGGLSPAFAAPLAFWVLGERPGRDDIFLGLAAVVGALLFSWRGGAPVSDVGVALACASTLAYTAGNLLAKVALRRSSPSVVLASSRIFSLALVVGYGALAGGLLESRPGAAGIALVAAAAFAGNFASVLLYYRVLREASLSVTSVVRVAGPVATAACAWPFFPMSLTSLNVAGGAVLVGSVAWLGIGPEIRRGWGRRATASIGLCLGMGSLRERRPNPENLSGASRGHTAGAKRLDLRLVRRRTSRCVRSQPST